MAATATPQASTTMSGTGQNPHPLLENNEEKNQVVVKVGMVGDSQIGKTSLMVKYVEGSFDEDYIQTLGVNFMEKTISVRRTTITFSIWDLGGQREFVNMLPLVCNDAVAILFMFELTRKATLNSVKEWYRQARGFNKTAIPFLIGTKFDLFTSLHPEEQEEITKQVYSYSILMIDRVPDNAFDRPSGLQKPCTHLSSFVRQQHPLIFRRFSKSFLQRRLTSNALSQRSTRWGSQFSSSWTWRSRVYSTTNRLGHRSPHTHNLPPALF
ncbi:hypothetical protein FS842_003536 [Serendipita sp. 407]|nr:hypothetical protein FS842_003536 [Serendipita sp. 407]